MLNKQIIPLSYHLVSRRVYRNLTSCICTKPSYYSSNINSNNHPITLWRQVSCRFFCTHQELTALQYDQLSFGTLDQLADFFDHLGESNELGDDYDMRLADGVLSIDFGPSIGAYVINRQAPNKQLWLSSPQSGPKRFDYQNGVWIYRHDGSILHELLSKEVSKILRKSIVIPFSSTMK